MECAVLTQARVGIIVDPQDVASIAERIAALYGRYQAGTLAAEPDWDVITQFDRRRLTGRLVEVFTHACETTRQG